jgi:hypothetical protein
MAPDTPAIEALRQTFGAAMDYGLSYEEVWEAVNEVVERTPPDTPAVEALEEIAAALSSRIHEKRGE